MNKLKLYPKSLTRNKAYSALSLKENLYYKIVSNKQITSTINTYKNKANNDDYNKTTNFYSSKDNITKNYNILFSNNKKNDNHNNKDTFYFNPQKSNKNDMINFTISNQKKNLKLNHISKLKKFNWNMNNNVQCETEIKNENENNNKICLLPKNLKIKNFNLKMSKIFEYLNLSSNNKFFKIENKRKNDIKKDKSPIKNKLFYKAKSALSINKLEKIKEIYPTVFNIEGKRNRQILSEIELQERRKIKKEKRSNYNNKEYFELRKKMTLEKWKTEEYLKANLSNIAYRRQLLIISMKFYQRAIKHLKKKNSLKFNLDLPLYNVFLNLD